jgi:hypothetical protein
MRVVAARKPVQDINAGLHPSPDLPWHGCVRIWRGSSPWSHVDGGPRERRGDDQDQVAGQHRRRLFPASLPAGARGAAAIPDEPRLYHVVNDRPARLNTGLAQKS